MKAVASSPSFLRQARSRAAASVTLALLLPLSAASAQPSTEPPVPLCVDGPSATVGFIPGTTSDKTFRREHARISSALATALGITPDQVDPAGEVSRQIRVKIASPLIGGLVSNANFTVTQIFNDPQPRVLVYNRQSTSDKDSGYFKLFGTTVVDLATVSARAFAVAPSSTVLSNGGSTITLPHFCEPAANGSKVFREEVILSADKRFALLVPHGGAIELQVSNQVVPVMNTLAQVYSVAANLWEGDGQWGNNQTFQRWHITSDAIHRASFPGLDTLLNQPLFAVGQPFQYAAALHGFGYTGNGVIVGGRASREAKCLIVGRIQDQLAAAGRSGAIAFHIADVGGNDLSVPNGSGQHLASLTTVGGLTGTDRNNIVNRLAPNETSQAGFGGFQLEQSSGVRNDSVLRNAVAQGLAQGVGELLTSGTPGNACAQL